LSLITQKHTVGESAIYIKSCFLSASTSRMLTIYLLSTQSFAMNSTFTTVLAMAALSATSNAFWGTGHLLGKSINHHNQLTAAATPPQIEHHF